MNSTNLVKYEFISFPRLLVSLLFSENISFLNNQGFFWFVDIFIFFSVLTSKVMHRKRDASVKHTLGCLWYVLQKIRSH